MLKVEETLRRLFLLFQLPCRFDQNFQGLHYFAAFFSAYIGSEIIHPAMTFFDSLFDQLLAFFGKGSIFGTAVIGIFDTFDQFSLHKFIHN